MKNKRKKNRPFNTVIDDIYNSKNFIYIRRIVDYLKNKIETSIRFELMVVFAICFSISFGIYVLSNDVLRDSKSEANIVYDYESIDNNANNYINEIKELVSSQESINSSKFFMSFMDNINSTNSTAVITDLDGNVIYKSPNVVEDKMDIFTVLANNSNESEKLQGDEKRIIYPFKLAEDRYYFIYSAVPDARIEYENYVVGNPFLALVISVIVFIIMFIIITNKKIKYLDEIALGLNNIATGDLDYRIREVGNDEIRNLAFNINNMAEEIKTKIEAERLAEKTKADLITNVSHDLRTPLTSIMGYIGLVKDGRYESEEKMKEYLKIAFNKAEKLKVLIEDLFEYTKLNNQGIKIEKERVNISEFICQLIEELMPIFESNNLVVKRPKVKEKIFVDLDPSKMLRVFENILTNAVKYSYKPGEIVVSIYKEENFVTISVSNKGEHISQEKLSKLFERFYRVDESRNAETGGSGLGLAISKNIVELHGGEIWAECYGENIILNIKMKTSQQ